MEERRRASPAHGRRRRQRVLSLLVVIAALAGSVSALWHGQRQSESALRSRYTARAVLAASFADTYVEQLFAQERAVAVSQLAGSTAAFATVVRTFGFTNAVLLDEHGRVIEVYPTNPAVVGKAIASSYPHLTTAVAGRDAVSPVVPAASDGAAVVGFAVPFSTAHGLRVFSGAYAVGKTPLAAYLRAMASLPGSRVYLIDDKGAVLASSIQGLSDGTLQEREPLLAARVAAHRAGTAGPDFWAARKVRGTPWTVVSAVPTRSLLAPVNGLRQVLPWLILAGLFGAVLLVWVLVFRRFEDHDKLRQAYRELDLLAAQDALTGLPNRRCTREHLDGAHASFVGRGEWVSVVMVDVDHFKRINDTFGHLVGDHALVAVGDRLRLAVRDEDLVGRWGGEEFLVVLPGASPGEAETVAERLRTAVNGSVLAVGSGGDEITISVSLGVASTRTASPEVLIYTADRAMYRAKEAGRDRVVLLGT